MAFHLHRNAIMANSKRHIPSTTIIAALLAASLSAFASPRCDTCPRDSNGRIQRSASAIKDFKRTNPCPATGKSTGRCSGYVIDHVVPLKRGGADAAGNMQWQTKEAAKEKDRLE